MPLGEIKERMVKLDEQKAELMNTTMDSFDGNSNPNHHR